MADTFPQMGLQSVRIVRQTNNIDRLIRFYRDGLGLEIIESFENYKDYTGITLGLPSWQCHLEITQHKSRKLSTPPDKDSFLVLYLEEKETIGRLTVRLGAMGYYPVTQEHPLYAEVGVIFEDPDGWRIMLVEYAPH